jgi:alpha-L-rhamnosidase
LALVGDLIPEEHRDRIGTDLASWIESRGALTAGTLGAPAICEALTQTGRVDLAYRLLLGEGGTSWLSPLSQGATTVGDFGTDPVALCRTAGAAIGEWLYRTLGGIGSDPDTAGLQSLVFQPQPGPFAWARSRWETPYGLASLAWTKDDSSWTLELEVPPNTQATLILPDIKAVYGSGRWTVSVPLAPKVNEIDQP